MTDIVDKKTRSRMMSGIRDRNTKPELTVRKYLHGRGLRYRLHATLPGKPDLAFPRYRAVVFVHGCFWHRHPGCKYATNPGTNTEFWQAKFKQNVERDHRVCRELGRSGWRVFVIWECSINPDKLAELADKIRKGNENDQTR